MSMPSRPIVSPPGAWRQPIPTLTRTPLGLTIAAHDLPGQRVASVRLTIPTSLASEDAGREGATLLMTRLLDEGCTGHSAEEFAVALERHGIVLAAGAIDGGVSVDLDVPARRLPEALALLGLAVREPTFPPDQVQRILRNRLAEIDHENSSAPHRAGREFLRTLWARGQRAAVPAGGTAESVAALTRDDLVARHTALGPQGATLVVAGHLAGIDLESIVVDAFAGWPASEPAPPTVAPDVAGSGNRIVLVDRPGSVQSELLVGAAGPDRRDATWPAHPVLAYLLGGSPTARIDADLREAKGWTYGMRAAARPRVAGGSFVASGSVRSDVTAPALERLVAILEEARAGFAEGEVRAGIDFITRATPGRWGTADVVAEETAGLALEDLPWDFPQRTLERTLDLTPQDLSQAWSEIGREGWAIVVVGDAEAQEEPLRALGLGDVSVVTV